MNQVEIDKQRAISEFVDKNILYCVNELCEEFWKEQDFCEAWENFYGKEEVQEILQYWIVVPWFFRELKKAGEPVCEYKGLYLWGRCCYGQAIYMDNVMEKIYDKVKNYY